MSEKKNFSFADMDEGKLLRSNKNPAYFTYIAALLIFGTNGLLVSRISLQGGQIVLMRTLIGGIFLTGLVLFRGGFNLVNVKKEIKPLILGGSALGLNWVMLFSAYRLLNVSISTLIYYAGPMLVLLLSPILFKESLSIRKILSIGLTGLGLVLISGSIILEKIEYRGLIFAILSAVFYALLIVFNKQIRKTGGLETAAIELDIAFVVVLIYVLITEGLFQISKGDLPYITVIGLVNTGLAYVLYFYSIQKLPGQSVALLSYIDPVSALIFSTLLLNENMTGLQILGAGLIIGGAIFGEIKKSSEEGDKYERI